MIKLITRNYGTIGLVMLILVNTQYMFIIKRINLKYFEKYKLRENIQTKWCDISIVKVQNLILKVLKDI